MVLEALVPGAGLEPAHLSVPDFKSGMSTNSIIRARKNNRLQQYVTRVQCFPSGSPGARQVEARERCLKFKSLAYTVSPRPPGEVAQVWHSSGTALKCIVLSRLRHLRADASRVRRQPIF